MHVTALPADSFRLVSSVGGAPIEVVAETAQMRVVCAWCKAPMGAKSCVPSMAGLVSHGICPQCSEQLLAERNFTASAVAAQPLSLFLPGSGRYLPEAAVGGDLPGSKGRAV